MPIPDVQSLVVPVLSAIAAVGEIGSADLRQQIATQLQLTDADLAEMLSGGVQTAFTNRVSWALVSLQNSGLIEKAGPKRYRVTGAGLQALRDAPNKISFQSAPLRTASPIDRNVRPNCGMVTTPTSFVVPNITPEEQIGGLDRIYVQAKRYAAGNTRRPS